MRQRIKTWLTDFIYQLHRRNILRNKIKIMTIYDTLETLIHSDKSMVRFGDAEIKLATGEDVEFQYFEERLALRLQEILCGGWDDLLVCLPDIFGSLEAYNPNSRAFWKSHIFFYRKKYRKLCNTDYIYGNSFVSRFHYIFQNKVMSKKYVEKWKMIWEGKEVVLVEGTVSHNGVDNDLFDHVKQLDRIICPYKDAYQVYEEIKEKCYLYPKDKLFLLSVGITAKALILDLIKEGYRAIDIGNLDMEYHWYLQKAEEKITLAKHKYITREQNEAAGYYHYLQQIKYVVESNDDC